MTVAQPIFSLKDFVDLIAHVDRYPFYAALLYTPTNGLDGKLHQYVVGHWNMLNRLTGDACLLMAVEDPWGKSIGQFKPEEVYDIARHLGAEAQDVPCLVFFTDPNNRQDTLVLRLAEFLSPSSSVTDEGLTDFFRALQSIIDQYADHAADARLQDLRVALDREWPVDSPWLGRASQVGTWAVSAAAGASTIVGALAAAKSLFGL